MGLQPEEEVAGAGAWRCQLLHVLPALGFAGRKWDWSLKAHGISGRFHFDLSGTRTMLWVSFKLVFGAGESHPCAFSPPQSFFYFLFYLYVFIASGKIWFGFTRAHRAADLPAPCGMLERLGRGCQWLLRDLPSSARANPPHPHTRGTDGHCEGVGTNPGG